MYVKCDVTLHNQLYTATPVIVTRYITAVDFPPTFNYLQHCAQQISLCNHYPQPFVE